MSISANPDNIFMGETSTITITLLQNVTWTPVELIVDSGINSDGNYYAIVSPMTSTKFIAKGTDMESNVIEIDIIVYVNISVEQSSFNIVNGQTITLVAYGSDVYTWSPTTYLNNYLTPVVQASPMNSITYTVEGLDYFGRITYATVEVVTQNNMIIEPVNPIVYQGDAIQLTIINNSPELTYEWKPLEKIYNNDQYVQAYGTNATFVPLYTKYLTVYGIEALTQKILIEQDVKITVIDKPPHLLDLDFLPYEWLEPIIHRNKKALRNKIIQNPILRKKVSNFYYTQLSNSYQFFGANKQASGFTLKWKSLQEVKTGRQVIVTYGQQYNLWYYINNNQTRNGSTRSNFAFMMNIINELFYERPQKVYIINQ